MTKDTRTTLFVGGGFLPPYEIVTFESPVFLDEQVARKLFEAQLELRKKEQYCLEGMSLLNDLAAAGVYKSLLSDMKTIFVASSIPTSFAIHVDRLMGESTPDELKMTELVNIRMLLEDIGDWTMGQVLELKEISITLVQC